MPSTANVLQVGPLKPSSAETLRTRYRAQILPDDAAARAEFLAGPGADVTAVVTSGPHRVDAALMAELPRLGAVVNLGVGYDTTDVDAAALRGVGVSNTPDVLTGLRRRHRGGPVDRHHAASSPHPTAMVRAGRWPVDGNYPLTRQVSNTRVGIIGLGRIGGAIAKRLGAFGCTNQLPQPPRGHRLAIVPTSGRRSNSRSGSRCWWSLPPAEAPPASWSTPRYSTRSACRRLPDQHRPRQRRRRDRPGRRTARRPAGRRRARRVRRRSPTSRPSCSRWTTWLLLHVGSGTVQTRAAMEDLTLRNLDEPPGHRAGWSRRCCSPVPASRRLRTCSTRSSVVHSRAGSTSAAMQPAATPDWCCPRAPGRRRVPPGVPERPDGPKTTPSGCSGRGRAPAPVRSRCRNAPAPAWCAPG